jgi:MoaA/NifB/PqqE/SkfB family radical SAM enzyme
VSGEALTAAVADVPLLDRGHLTSVDVYITSQCNRRCTYCFLTADFLASRTHMSIDLYDQILTWSQKHGVGEITLLGGEPSLHPEFTKMVTMAHDGGMGVRVVTNGTNRFRRLLEGLEIGPSNLSRVAVSLDSMDEKTQDSLRGPRAWRDARATINLLNKHQIPFDINVTALRSVLGSVESMVEFAESADCRRLNIHWPSAIGLGSQLPADEIPDQEQWMDLVRRIEGRTESRTGFFVEIERGFLGGNEKLTGCALTDFSNLQIFPDGRAYRCGLLVDRPGMASLSMTGDNLIFTQRESGEEGLASTLESSCRSCPAVKSQDHRACIYDKVSSTIRP